MIKVFYFRDMLVYVGQVRSLSFLTTVEKIGQKWVSIKPNEKNNQESIFGAGKGQKINMKLIKVTRDR